MAMLRSQFSDLFFSRLAYIDQVFQEDYMDFPELWSQIFTVKGSSRLQEDITGVTGLGLMETITEGDTFPTDNILPGYQKSFRHVWYAILVEMSKLAVADDADGIFSRVPRAISRTVKVTKETYFWNILNNGLATVGTELTPDGVSLFNTAHPYVDPLAGTGSNYAAADLSESSLETALTSFMDQTDHRGKPVVVNAAKLWVSSADIFEASRILDSTGRVGTANNDTNAMSHVAPQISYQWSPYITDTDSWFLLAEKGTHALTAYMRQDVELDHDVDFRTKTAMTSADMRFVGGPGDWIGTYGSAGA
jgi:hypothetical protein